MEVMFSEGSVDWGCEARRTFRNLLGERDRLHDNVVVTFDRALYGGVIVLTAECRRKQSAGKSSEQFEVRKERTLPRRYQTPSGAT